MSKPVWPSDFGPVPLPDKFKPDERWINQLDIAYEIVERFRTDKVVFLQAPTGTGKTLIGELVRRLLSVDAVYSCTTKALQDQFVHDFTYAKVLKGRTNYLTASGSITEYGLEVSPDLNEVTAVDCNFTPDRGKCSWCPSQSVCPYKIARTQAENSELAVLNTSYLLTDANKGSRRFAGRGLVILDEADVVEDELLNQVEVVITARRMEQMKLQTPRRKTVQESWVEWMIKEAEPKIALYLRSLPNPNRMRGVSVKDGREYERVSALYDRVADLARAIHKGGWVYDGYNRGHVIFRPVKVDNYGHSMLWNTGNKFLAMSATILSADLMVDELGLCKKEDVPYSIIDLPSEFPVENRIINVAPIANMTFKEKLQSWPKMAEAIQGVMALHPYERILVHCVSYELAESLHRHCSRMATDRPILTYLNGKDKMDVLDKYKRSERSVLFAASMDRGIDLPDDLCRVQVVAKIPWPNLGDKRVNARSHSSGGSAWYRMHAIRSLIQMTGRGVRSPTDWATTYIFDAQFSENLWQNGEYMFPQWWKESLNWRFNRRTLKI